MTDVKFENNSKIILENLPLYINDTACSHTHAPFIQYIDSLTFKYNNFPYDNYNQPIINNKHKKNLSKFNDQILYARKIESKNANDFEYDKILIYLKDNTVIFIDDKHVYLKAMTCHILLYEPDEKKYNFSIIQSLNIYKKK